MTKSEKQASLSSVLLAARKAAALAEENVEAAGATPNLRVVPALPEAFEEVTPPPLPPPANERPTDLMFSKGAASAAGFRPAHWTYARTANSEAAAEDGGEVPPAPSAVAGSNAPSVQDPRLVAKRRLQWAVIGFGAVALVVSTTPLLNMGSAPVVKTVPLVVTVTPPVAASAPPVAASASPVATPAPMAVAVKPIIAPVPPAPVQAAPQISARVAPAAVPVAPQPAATGPARTDADNMLVRGIAALETGDVASARLYLERAAGAPDARAALLLGQSFDPIFLKRIGALGVRGDSAQAAEWYHKARALGEPTAQAHLDSLGTTK